MVERIRGRFLQVKDIENCLDTIVHNQEILESFVYYTPDAISLMDLDGKILKINPGFQIMYGWTIEEVQQEEVCIIPDFLKAETEEIVQRAIKGEDIRNYETLRKRKDGTLINVSISISPVRNEEGQIIALATITRDISERKLSEMKLRENEERYRSLVEHNPALICSFDMEGRILNANPITEKLTGYSAEELIGKKVTDFLMDQDMQKTKEFLHKATSNEPESFEYTFIHKEGHAIELGGKCVPIIVGEEMAGYYIIAKDITERKRTEELLRRSEKLSAVGQLAAGVAHEIRNPLTSLKGFVQLLRSGAEHKEEYFDIMHAELDRIETIIDELLLLSKPQPLNIKICSLKIILKHVVTLLETQAIMNNVLIETEIEIDNPEIECEESQLKQVFINLLKNAIEAMPKGGKVTIQVGRHDANWVYVRFIDEGEGIPVEKLSRVGEPFYTTKQKGTGLGLMVSYKIIENHQGSIVIDSHIGKGTTVEVLLPFTLNHSKE